jgi:hypothetical protein
MTQQQSAWNGKDDADPKGDEERAKTLGLKVHRTVISVQAMRELLKCGLTPAEIERTFTVYKP